MTLTLTKHHGLGNDFLVLVDPYDHYGLDAALARRLCDRHVGVGADGVIRAGPGRDGADVTMEVRNADGTEAEMSGNGIRCLAQAVLDAALVPGPGLAVATAAGLRHLVVRPGEGPSHVWVEVEMGPAEVGSERPVEPPAQRARPVSMGNPHLVVLGPDPAALDLAVVGPQLQAGYPGGANVELVALGPGGDELTMRVWERGVGETLACGTGACAAAAAVHEWGLVGPQVAVHQPGGALRVDLKPDGVVLTGPAQRVARVEVDLS